MLVKNEIKNNRTKVGNDSPILDVNNSTIKSLIKKGKLNGFVTLDELNQALPPGEFTLKTTAFIVESSLALFIALTMVDEPILSSVLSPLIISPTA